jgi:hypothetical protein
LGIPREELSPTVKQKFILPTNEDLKRATLKMQKYLCPYNDKNMVKEFMEFHQDSD